MSETKDRRDSPGFRENLRNFDNASMRDQIDAKLKFWRSQANRSEYALRLGELADPENAPDWDALAHAPLFEIDKSFPTWPPPDFEPGTEPPMAPISREQFRLLLVKTLPDDLKPFIEEKFIFKYDVSPLKDGKAPKRTPGPTIDTKSVKGKVVVTFYRDNFLSKGKVPGNAPDSDDARRARYTWSFVDPAKISFLIGKVVGAMTEPTDDEKKATEFDPNFHKFKASKPTDAIFGPLLGGIGEEDPDFDRPFGEQWQDFVGLCVTLPDEAKKISPAAFALFQSKVANFRDPANDKDAIARLPESIEDCQVTYYDLRTPGEKAAENPPSPQRNFLDRVYGTANRALSPFNLRLIYEVPEDEERAAALADDDKEVSNLIENYDQKTRDEKFGDILSEPKNKYDHKARNIARRYLIAASKEGEFEEWRIFAWLKQFSKTFNEPGNGREIGSVISEDDYRDLRLIYRISEKEGNRLGSGVIPYEPKSFKDPFQSHEQFVYLRRKEADYIAAVRKKVDAKSARGVYDSNPKSFDQFTKNGQRVDLNAEFGPATLLPILKDAKLANEMAEVLKIMGVKVISTDARAVAEAYWGHYIANGRRPTDHMSQEAIEVIVRYGDELNRPATDETQDFLRTDPLLVANWAPEDNAKKMEESDVIRRKTEGAILGELERVSVNNDVKDRLAKLLSEENITGYKMLEDKMNAFITEQALKATGSRNAEAEKREVKILLLANRKNLENLRGIIEWQQRAEPAFVADIEAVKEELKTNKTLVSQIVPAQLSEDRYNAEFKDIKGVTLTTAQENLIAERQRVMTTLDAAATSETADIVRAEEVKKNVMASPDEARLPLIGKLMEKGYKELRAAIQQATIAGGGYKSAYERWLKANPIYETPRIKTAFTDKVESLTTSMEIAREESRARIRQRLDTLVVTIPRAWHDITSKKKKAP